MKKIILHGILLSAGVILQAQTSIISGMITDEKDQLPIPGAYVIGKAGQGTTSNEAGYYSLEQAKGPVQLEFSAIGYQPVVMALNITTDTTIHLSLKTLARELNVVVVSGSLYEKKLTAETTSIDVVGAQLLKNNNAVTLADGVQKAPSVYLLDNQINIRGGTGFTYGAGSRVMVVLDDQTILASDRGDASINFLPMEIVDQLEVIKGSASVLYGSSAMNGVVALRTAWPGSEPKTNITFYNGIFDSPAADYQQWWDGAPFSSGVNFAHKKKYEKFDLVLSGLAAKQESNLQGQFSNRARLTWKTRFHAGDHKQLTYGVNGSMMTDNEGVFFLFADADTGVYQAFGGPYDSTFTTLLNWRYNLLSIDPWLNYHDGQNGHHRFRSRYYRTGVTYSDTTGGQSWMQNIDYQYNKTFNNHFVLTTGASGYYFHVDDDQLLQHKGFSGGVYLQADQQLFNRLNLNFGVREEFFAMDTLDFVAVPIFKGGASYQLFPQTFIRSSYGQGFRVPSLPERYAKTNLGVLYIFPNPEVTAEYGWNAELGLKKTWANEAFSGYTDVAFYVTDYYDMTEFIFDFYLGEGLGFKSLNTGRARIAGLELTAAGEGNVLGNPFSLIGGYNYCYPANLSSDSSLYNWGEFLGNFVAGFNNTDSAFVSQILKYRFRHMLRLDAEYKPNNWTMGLVVNYYSYMENIDYVFETFGIPEGLSDFRAEHVDGDWVWDARAGYRFNERITGLFIVRNLTNKVYAIRPGKTEWNRNFLLQFSIDL
jgi:outer membrane receptor protein involved in Fe transport